APFALEYLQSRGLRLHAVVRGARGRPVAVMADPFAEEKKCAHRVLAETAGALAEAGVTVLRFDYGGTGDSEGDFCDQTLADWEQDLVVACEWTRRELAPTGLALAGVRLGAVLVARVAPIVKPDVLVLVAPVTDGKAYWQENFRRQLIKEKLTAGESATAEKLRAAEAAEFFDLAGWLVSRRMREELQSIRLSPQYAAGSAARRCLVLDVAARPEPSAESLDLARAFPGGEAAAIRMEPFWQRIGLVDAKPLVEILCRWLPEALGQAAV
ncbi:MAG: alpha/beta hydrolase, partial [Armatimonadetes bacterium]|nr:alpha/beta hydrolase [Armatimonadota bacterium]